VRTLTRALAALALATTAACGSGRYVHPTKSGADFTVDQAECQQEAARLFPPSYREGEVGDQNETSRLGSTTSCLRKRGWHWQTERGSP
jgi:hypothetical protein